MTQHVDWAEVERRGRRREWLGLPLLFARLGGIAGLGGRFAGFAGRGGWIAAAVYLVAFVALVTASHLLPRRRALSGAGHRIRYALRHRVDPGPDLRERTDTVARRAVALAWFRWWIYLLVPALFIAGGVVAGRFAAQPHVSVVSALALTGATVVVAWQVHRSVRAARCWLADPPGPERDVPTLRGWERWLTGRMAGLALLALLLVPMALAAVIAALR